ncbi:MAG TPA: hypothetical protein PKK68_09170, partial [Methanothrix soehngenii]|nr:hypothetical protein [Methanothrix soehngenii]
KDLYRFEFKSTGARNNALKLLERNYDLLEDLKGYVVQFPKHAKYAQPNPSPGVAARSLILQ